MLSRVLPYLSSWLGGLRWRELGAIVSAAYMGGLQLAETVGVEPAKQQQVAFVLAALATACYVLNPKYATWVEAVAPQQPTPVEDSQDYVGKMPVRYNISGDGLDYDPYANSQDEEVRNA